MPGTEYVTVDMIFLPAYGRQTLEASA
jgi:hypothetical protein